MPTPRVPVWYPPPPPEGSELAARLAAGAPLSGATCPVCGHQGPIAGFTDNLRESGHCERCGAWTRIRQMAAVLMEVATRMTGRQISAAADLVRALKALRVYNTEARGPLHDLLSGLPGYVASEYLGPHLRSGDRSPDGVLHQDLHDLSFASESFDLVLSTDVFEHVFDPYRAHGEVYRVLRPGGHHVFTVPYVEGMLLDDVRATVAADGTVKFLAEPLYHGDPVRPTEGALVYTIFGLEMLPNLSRLGMETTVYRPEDPDRGLVGGGVVFDALRRGVNGGEPPPVSGNAGRRRGPLSWVRSRATERAVPHPK